MNNLSYLKRILENVNSTPSIRKIFFKFHLEFKNQRFSTISNILKALKILTLILFKGKSKWLSNWSRMEGCKWVTMILVFCLPYNNASSDTIYVNQNATGNPDGQNWNDAFTHLQDALEKANFGDEIWIVSGTFVPGDQQNDSFQLKNGIALYGGFNGTESSPDERLITSNLTTLSGDINGDDDGLEGNVENCYHVITGPSDPIASTIIIDGITIASGNANGEEPNDKGGGIKFNSNRADVVLRISNCVFRYNSAIQSGALHSTVTLFLTDSTFENNQASGSSGAATIGGQDTGFLVRGCTFAGNMAKNGEGGSLSLSSSGNEAESEFSNCTFFENSASVNGGAVKINKDPKSVQFSHCSFIANFAGHSGGAISMLRNATVISDVSLKSRSFRECKFFRNQAESRGGAIDHWETISDGFNASYSNCLLSGNTASNGGAMYFRNGSNADVTIKITNCSISGNLQPNKEEEYTIKALI